MCWKNTPTPSAHRASAVKCSESKSQLGTCTEGKASSELPNISRADLVVFLPGNESDGSCPRGRETSEFFHLTGARST